MSCSEILNPNRCAMSKTAASIRWSVNSTQRLRGRDAVTIRTETDSMNP